MFTLMKIALTSAAVVLSGQSRSTEPMSPPRTEQIKIYQQGVWPMVEHAFQVESLSETNPFVHQVWAIIEKPKNATSSETVVVPAFYDGDKTWKIRYSPDRPGKHRVITYR